MNTPRKLIQQVIRELDHRFGIEHAGDLSIKLLQADQLLADSEQVLHVDPAERWPSVAAQQLRPVREIARRQTTAATVRRDLRVHCGGRRRLPVAETDLGLVS
jgi:hypothetical protein